MTKSHVALEGIRVLDVTQVMAGPFCAMMLADLGANVVKVEPPAGDSTRQMPAAVGTDSPAFNAVNRGKRSIVLNLKAAQGRDVFARRATRGSSMRRSPDTGRPGHSAARVASI